MIVKDGRLYLWNNTIAGKELIIKVGTGTGTNDFVRVEQTELERVISDAAIEVTSQDEFNEWESDNETAGLWHSSISDITSKEEVTITEGEPPVTLTKFINRYIHEDIRKIIIYIKITAAQAFELGEIGLFVKGNIISEEGVTPVVYDSIMISRNLMHKQHISTTESKIIKYTINI